MASSFLNHKYVEWRGFFCFILSFCFVIFISLFQYWSLCSCPVMDGVGKSRRAFPVNDDFLCSCLVWFFFLLIVLKVLIPFTIKCLNGILHSTPLLRRYTTTCFPTSRSRATERVVGLIRWW